jgi:SAM-dependent methyltransferase
MAAPHFDDVLVADLETLEEREVAGEFEVLLFSHVLEHLRDPVRVVRRLLPLLVPGGHVVVAVPNVLEWRIQMQFLRGRFVYADHGILDRTHMRFFTYVTAPNELIAPIEGLRLLEQTGRGAVPLGPLRRLGAARALCAALDRAGVARWPNFCWRETAMLARWEVERA